VSVKSSLLSLAEKKIFRKRERERDRERERERWKKDQKIVRIQNLCIKTYLCL
jgi:hypothetical protein